MIPRRGWIYLVLALLLYPSDEVRGQDRPNPFKRPKSFVRDLPHEVRYLEVASTKITFEEFFGEPTINRDGAVAFVARNKSTVTGVYSGSYAPTLRNIASTANKFDEFLPHAVIGPMWDVIFTAFIEFEGTGIFIAPPGKKTMLVVDDSETFSTLKGMPAINVKGEVVFFARVWDQAQFGGIESVLDSPDKFQGIFVQDSKGDVSVVADDLGIFEEFEPWVDIADNGAVAFVAKRQTQSKGVFMHRGGVRLVPIATDEFRYAEFGPPVLDRLARVAFWTRLKTQHQAVMLGDGTGARITELAITDDEVFTSFDKNVAINDNGTVAYVARLHGAPTLYLDREGRSAVRVLSYGQPLESGVVKDIHISPHALNMHEQVTCRVDFEGEEEHSAIVMIVPTK